MEVKNVACGVRLWTQRTKKFNTNSICFLIRQTASKKTASINSLLLRIMGSCCEKYDSIGKMNRELENMNGASFQYNIVKKGSEQILAFYIECMSGTEKEAVLFMQEIIYRPLICDYVLDIERKKLEDHIKSLKTNKRAYSLERCTEIMCENEPFGVNCDGYLQDIRSITIGDIVKKHVELLKAAPIEIMAVGDFDFDILIPLIPEHRNYNFDNKPKIPYSFTGTNSITEYAPVEQTNLCIGLRTNILPQHNKYFSLMVFNEMLGGNATSKLFSQIREKQSLCYYINSTLYSSEGIIIIQSGNEYKDCKKIVSAVRELIENPNNENIEQAKKNLISKYRIMADSPRAVMDFTLAQTVFGTDKSPEEMIKGIEQVKDIREIKCYVDTVYILTGEKNGKNNSEKAEKRDNALCYT